MQLKCRGEEDFTWRGGGGRWWCCGGGRWHCRGSRTAAPGGAAAVSHGVVRSLDSLLYFCFLSFVPVSSFPLPLSFGFFSGGSLMFGCFSLLLSLFGFFSFLPPLSSLLSSPFFPPFSFSIYRRERELGPLLVRLGIGFHGGWSATTRDSKASLPCFWQGEWPVGQ